MMRTAILPRLAAIVAATLLVAVAAGRTGSAQDSAKIVGSVYLAGKTAIDPPPGEPKNTHAHLTIQGQGALRMYRAMRAREQDDACRGDGWRIKRAGHLACAVSRNGAKAECDFAVELERGLLAAGNAC